MIVCLIGLDDCIGLHWIVCLFACLLICLFICVCCRFNRVSLCRSLHNILMSTLLPGLFVCDPFSETVQYDDDGFGFDDDDYLQKQKGGSICAVEACAGDLLVANVCEEYTGDTFLRLFDSDWSLIAENDDVVGSLTGYDDDESDNAVLYGGEYFGAGPYYGSVQYGYGINPIPGGSEGVGALCSKIVYLVPDLVNTSSLAPECSTYYIQQSCRGEGSCSGRTRVAGGIAAPTSLPTSVPTPAPSTPEEFKESVFVYSFRTRLTVQFECEGARCDGLAEMDGSSQEAFREVFAGSMSSVSLDDVSIVSVSLYSSYWPTFRGVFATTSKTGNASGIDAAIAALTAESQASFLDGSMSAQFVNRSVELGSKSVNRSTTVYFGVPETSAHVEKQEVQTYPPSGVPTVAPSGHPSRAPSASPSSDPTRGECDCCCLGFDCC